MKRPPHADAHAAPPARRELDAQLRQQQRDFTDEGSPPPGRVGKNTPRRAPRDDDEPTGDRSPCRR